MMSDKNIKIIQKTLEKMSLKRSEDEIRDRIKFLKEREQWRLDGRDWQGPDTSLLWKMLWQFRKDYKIWTGDKFHEAVAWNSVVEMLMDVKKEVFTAYQKGDSELISTLEKWFGPQLKPRKNKP